jgi:HlyD family secretion protein
MKAIKGIKNMKKKWVVTLVLGILVVGGGGYWAYQHFKPTPQTSSLITSAAKKGDVKKLITATGTVKYPEEVPLAFETAGTVKEVYVQAGDTVTAGQVLAQMDTETLQQEVQESNANLKEAGVNWQQQKVQAEATLVKAKDSLRTAERNADPAYLANQVNIEEQNVQIASNNLAKAQQSGDDSSISQAKASLAQAQNKLLTAQDAQNGGAAQALEAAKADVAIAEAKLNQLKEQTSLAQAQTAVVKAQENLAKATLVAPADGVLIDVPTKKGQTIKENTTVMTLATGGNLLTVDSSVSQAEVSDIKVGQKVNITLDSAPNDIMIATVSNVALKATTTQNVTTFNVQMKMDQPSELLRAGMNVNVGIVIAEVKDVLTVPSQAIRTQGNQKGVLVVQNSTQQTGTNRQPQAGNSSKNPNAVTPPNGTQQQGTQQQGTQQQGTQQQGTQQQGGNRSQNSSSTGNRSFQAGSQGAAVSTDANTLFVPVEIGLDDGTNVEIKSGLTEGQVIVVGTRTTSTNSNTNTNSRSGSAIPGIGGGGGGLTGTSQIRIQGR